MITYKDSGVNIEEGYESVKLIKEHAKRTMIPGVINDLGSFAGMFELHSPRPFIQSWIWVSSSLISAAIWATGLVGL